jgi:hypothetical protein
VTVAPLGTTVEAPLSVAEAIVGEVPNTAEPLPVSSEIMPANCTEVVDANWESGFVVSP